MKEYKHDIKKIGKVITGLIKKREKFFIDLIEKLKSKFNGRVMIILFGSRVRGTNTPFSDYDLLVVVNEITEDVRSDMRIRAFAGGVDLHIYTIDELIKGIREPNTVILDGIFDGRLIYDGMKIYNHLKSTAEKIVDKLNIRKLDGGWIVGASAAFQSDL